MLSSILESMKSESKFKKPVKIKKAAKPEAHGIETVRVVRLVLAAFLLFMLLGQLFTFEDFPSLLVGMNEVCARAVVILLVVFELLALPFLIDMKVSVTLKKVSVVSVFVALVLLSVLEIAAYLGDVSMLFGATFDLPCGSWSLTFLAGLWVLAVWGVMVNKISRCSSVCSRRK